MENKTTRVEMRFPSQLLKEIEKYQEINIIQNRTVAILELIRKGLKLNE